MRQESRHGPLGKNLGIYRTYRCSSGRPGDLPLLRFARTGSRAALRLLVLHDDDDREFAYTAGAEDALERAKERGWTIVSVKNDWGTVFADV